MSDLFVIPHPRFRVDRFADRAEQTQTRQIVLGRPLIAPFDESADGCRGRIEDIHSILFDNLPEAILARLVRRPSYINVVAPLHSGP